MEKLKKTPYIASLALLGYMPFHIFLSQWLSTYTGGLEVWKIGKDIALFLLVLFTICLVWLKGKSNKIFNTLVFVAAGYAALHILIWVINPDIYRRSAEIGLIYNMRLLLFAILGAGSVIMLPKFVFSSVIKVILIVSTVVASLGLLQYVLPGDLLTHFGYSLDRGARAAFYIDDNHALPVRIMSTLREPNALAAYLLLPSAALGLYALRLRKRRMRIIVSSALAVHLIAIVLTASRSALIGVILALILVLWWQYQDWFVGMIKRFWPVLAVGIVLVASSLFMIRSTAFFDNYIAHSNKNEQVKDLDSNQYHALYIQQGLEGIERKPLGHGPGTAGLASIQNPNGGQLTENYYLQIGFEIGVLGLLMFVAINAWIYMIITKSGVKDIPVILCASFWGYVVMNMLLHTWSNEAVACQWWTLAGMVMGAVSLKAPDALLPRKDA